MTKNPTQLEAELKKLTGEGETVLYRKCEIASTLLKSDEWLAKHGGSIDQAEAYLSDKYFADLRGFLELRTLVGMYEKIDAETWQQHQYDLAAIETLYHETFGEQKETTTTRKRGAYKERCQELEAEVSELKARLATSTRLEQANESELEQLREKVATLSRENAVLEGRLKELERMLPKQVA